MFCQQNSTSMSGMLVLMLVQSLFQFGAKGGKREGYYGEKNYLDMSFNVNQNKFCWDVIQQTKINTQHMKQLQNSQKQSPRCKEKHRSKVRLTRAQLLVFIWNLLSKIWYQKWYRSHVKVWLVKSTSLAVIFLQCRNRVDINRDYFDCIQRTISNPNSEVHILIYSCMEYLTKTKFLPFKSRSWLTCEGHVGPVHFITHAHAMSVSLVFTWTTTKFILWE